MQCCTVGHRAGVLGVFLANGGSQTLLDVRQTCWLADRMGLRFLCSVVESAEMVAVGARSPFWGAIGCAVVLYWLLPAEL